ncbi:MAG: RNase adapter RapZ [Alphaproteobacteria bacterium]
MTKTANSGALATAAEQPDRRLRVVLITGMSGAGRSSALKALEDIGYEAVDNLPLSLLASLVASTVGTERSLAIGIDIRTRDFGVESILQELDALMRDPGTDVQLLFLDCEDDTLRLRYSETRRRHPLAGDRPLMDGIHHERRLVSPLRARADLVIDTTGLTQNDLRRKLGQQYAIGAETSFTLFLVSFAYRNGVPRESDLVFDVRFLDNPHYKADLRPLTGLDPDVAGFIARDPGFTGFFGGLTGLLAPLLPRFRNEGKSYLTISVGCTGGQHRSVYVAERLARWLRDQGEQVSVTHRELMPQPPKSAPDADH